MRRFHHFDGHAARLSSCWWIPSRRSWPDTTLRRPPWSLELLASVVSVLGRSPVFHAAWQFSFSCAAAEPLSHVPAQLWCFALSRDAIRRARLPKSIAMDMGCTLTPEFRVDITCSACRNARQSSVTVRSHHGGRRRDAKISRSTEENRKRRPQLTNNQCMGCATNIFILKSGMESTRCKSDLLVFETLKWRFSN